MITIVARNLIKEGKTEEYKALAEELIIESKKELGCISYSLNQDLNDKNVLTFIENWESREAIILHNNSSHFIRIIPKLGEFNEETPQINLYEQV